MAVGRGLDNALAVRSERGRRRKLGLVNLGGAGRGAMSNGSVGARCSARTMEKKTTATGLEKRDERRKHATGDTRGKQAERRSHAVQAVGVG